MVLHLFGQDDDPLSLVLTEDDHLDYLARIARDYEYLLPTSVNAALASTTLLFLGYRLEDLDLKVIMRGLLTHLDLDKWGMLHVAVQLEAAHRMRRRSKRSSATSRNISPTRALTSTGAARSNLWPTCTPLAGVLGDSTPGRTDGT